MVRVKQNKDKTLPEQVILEDLTIKAGDNPTKLELDFSRKLPSFIHSNTLNRCKCGVNQQDLIRYFTVKEATVIRDLGESAYHVNDAYETISYVGDSTDSVEELLMDDQEEEEDYEFY